MSELVHQWVVYDVATGDALSLNLDDPPRIPPGSAKKFFADGQPANTSWDTATLDWVPFPAEVSFDKIDEHDTEPTLQAILTKLTRGERNDLITDLKARIPQEDRTGRRLA